MLRGLKVKLFVVVTWLVSVLVLPAHALDRTQIASSAMDVTPILNGQSAPKAVVKTAEGAPVSLQAMIMQKPTIVLFYRGGWCPYCNRQLAELKDIEGQLVELGYQVLAISPESPMRLQEQKLETEFAVTLISDDSLQAIKGFGVGFYMADDVQRKYTNEYNIGLTFDGTTGRAVLPAPAVFIVDKQGMVQFSYVNPDYKTRLSASLLLEAARHSL